MRYGQTTAKALLIAGLLATSGCSGGLSGLFGGNQRQAQAATPGTTPRPERANRPPRESTIWDLFANRDDPNTTVEVNKYLWNAALDVLSFMPVKAADPFTGVIVFDYGTPPGGGRAYQATVFVRDPALDARSLNVALKSRGGPVSAETQFELENAILDRARQLRIQDRKL
ncbi:MAG: DUF3576 domain-containing protein [Maritimibacter sp.]